MPKQYVPLQKLNKKTLEKKTGSSGRFPKNSDRLKGMIGLEKREFGTLYELWLLNEYGMRYYSISHKISTS